MNISNQKPTLSQKNSTSFSVPEDEPNLSTTSITQPSPAIINLTPIHAHSVYCHFVSIRMKIEWTRLFMTGNLNQKTHNEFRIKELLKFQIKNERNTKIDWNLYAGWDSIYPKALNFRLLFGFFISTLSLPARHKNIVILLWFINFEFMIIGWK